MDSSYFEYVIAGGLKSNYDPIEEINCLVESNFITYKRVKEALPQALQTSCGVNYLWADHIRFLAF